MTCFTPGSFSTSPALFQDTKIKGSKVPELLVSSYPINVAILMNRFQLKCINSTTQNMQWNKLLTMFIPAEDDGLSWQTLYLSAMEGTGVLCRFFTSPEYVQNICLAVMAVIVSPAHLLAHCHGEHTGFSWRRLHHCNCSLMLRYVSMPPACIHWFHVSFKGVCSLWLMSIKRLGHLSRVKTTSLNIMAWGRGIKKNHNGSQGVKGIFLLVDL
jgi:hypothetical protein